MRRAAGLALGTVLLAAVTGAASAQQFPERTIKLLVPWAAGGDADGIFRPFAPLLEKHVGKPVVIANVVGASGTVGAREAKAAPPDGHTVLAVHDYLHLTYFAGVADVRYNDFEPICAIAATPSVLAAGPKTPFNSWRELVADGQRRPGAVTVAVTPGTTSQIFPVLLAKAAGLSLKHVAYDGLAARTKAILGGQVELTDSNLTQKEAAEARGLKFLAIASLDRAAEMPDVPTLKELGIDVVYEVTRGLMVPRGTPGDVRAKLGDACRKAAGEPAFAEAMGKQGTRVTYRDARGYRALLERVDAQSKAIMTELGLVKQ